MSQQYLIITLLDCQNFLLLSNNFEISYVIFEFLSDSINKKSKMKNERFAAYLKILELGGFGFKNWNFFVIEY